MKYNFYCDESCHLEHDQKKVMVLGAVKCPKKYKKQIVNDIRRIKEKFGINRFCEVKWTKVSNCKLSLYKELINYFFSNRYLSFRAVVVDKTKLKHDNFKQNHDTFYYKVYY